MQQIGRYQVIERLGKGAMGVVYKALDPRIGRIVAVKSIRLAEISDASELKKLRDRLEREARSSGALSHRNIVAIYDIFEEEKLVHLFMEYVNGPSLEKLLTDGRLPDKEALLSFFAQVASALDYAHKIGIVHRDVKPSNLLIHFEHATDEQIAKVTDFGVAKFMSQQMTQAGSMMGTPNYMAPEQIEGAQITGQADQFALAAVAYESLCGKKPFVADYIPTLFFRIVREEPKSAESVNNSLSPDVNKVLQQGLAKKPEHRFENCTQFVQALSEALSACAHWTAPYKMEALAMPVEMSAEQVLQTMGTRVEAAAATAAGRPSVRVSKTTEREAPPEELAAVSAAEQAQPADEQKPPQGPVILPYDLPYRLPELRRNRREDTEELPLWRKVAMVVLICAMAGIALAVYRNFQNGGAPETGAPITKESSTPAAQTPKSSAANSPASPPASAPAPANAPSANASQAPSIPKTAVSSLPSTIGTAHSTSASSKPLAKTPAIKETHRAASSKSHLPVEPPRSLASTIAVPVQFSSIPQGAHAVVDSDESKACTTPCSLSLPPGRHTVSMAAPNYIIANRIISVPDQRSVFVPMSQSAAMVQLDSSPTGSTLYVDGRLQGQTPASLRLSPGPHSIRLTSGNRNLEQTINVSSESLQSFLFRWQ